MPTKASYLTRGQAAEHLQKRGLRCSYLYLSQVCSRGTGPRVTYFHHHPMYKLEDLEEWAAIKKEGLVVYRNGGYYPAYAEIGQDKEPMIDPDWDSFYDKFRCRAVGDGP